MANEKHLLITWGGDYVPNTLPGEIWQCGVRVAVNVGALDNVGTLPVWDVSDDTIAITEATYTINGNWSGDMGGGITFSPGDYLNDQVEPAVANWMIYAALNNQVRLRWIKCSPIVGPSGNLAAAPGYAQGSPCTLEYTSSYPVGVLGGTQLPPQNSVVVSHRTLQVGPRGRGRMFLPSSSSSILSGARVATATVEAIAEAQRDLLQGLAYDDSLTTLEVRPIVTGSPWSAYALINSVQVGDVMDSQRRRRGNLTETYTTEAVTY